MDGKNTLSVKEWADKRFEEYKQDIQFQINEGVDRVIAFHMVMDSSTLGAGYKAQMRREFELGIFD